MYQYIAGREEAYILRVQTNRAIVPLKPKLGLWLVEWLFSLMTVIVLFGFEFFRVSWNGRSNEHLIISTLWQQSYSGCLWYSSEFDSGYQIQICKMFGQKTSTIYSTPFFINLKITLFYFYRPFPGLASSSLDMKPSVIEKGSVVSKESTLSFNSYDVIFWIHLL